MQQTQFRPYSKEFSAPPRLLHTDEFLLPVESFVLPAQTTAATPSQTAPPPTAPYAPATVSSESELRAAILANNSPINIAADFSLSNVVAISGGQEIVIQSLDAADIHTITRAPEFSSTYMFIIYNGSSLTIRNVAMNGAAYAAYTMLANLGTLHVEEGALLHNSAAGAVVNQGAMTVTGGVFQQNSSSGGGAIFSSNGGVLHISGGTFRENSVSLYGGAVYSNNAGITVTGGEFTENTAGRNGAGLCLVNNTAGSVGGNANIHHNNANETGGGITIQNSDIELLGDLQVTENTAPDYGGGVYSHSTTGRFSNISIYERVNISRNTAGSGGGVFAFYLSDIRIFDDVAITGNMTTEAFGNGGGIMFFDQAEGSIGGRALVQGNTAIRSGGGVFINEAGFVIGPDVGDAPVIAGNIAANGGGVAVMYSLSAVRIAANTTISNNTALDQGGGLSVMYEATVTVEGDAAITDNAATNAGGGALLMEAILQLKDRADISGNTAPQGSGVADFGLLRVQDSVRVLRVYLNSAQYLLELTGPLANNAAIGFEASDYINDTDSPIIVAQGGPGYPLPTGTDAAVFIPPFAGYESVLHNDTQIAFVLRSVTIRFDPNTQDLVENMPDTAVTVAGEFILPAEVPQREGYLFAGWSMRPNDAVLYQPGQTVFITGDLVFYARWIMQSPVPPSRCCKRRCKRRCCKCRCVPPCP